MFCVNSVEFTKKELEACPFLKGLSECENNGGDSLLSKEQLETIKTALNGNKVDDPSEKNVGDLDDATLDLLSFVGVIPWKVYSIACGYEDRLRREFYEKQDEDPEWRTNPYYDLVPLDDGFLRSFVDCSRSLRNLTPSRLRSPSSFEFQELDKARERLKDMVPVLELGNVFLAGGSVLAALTGKKVNDYDLFLFGLSPSECTEKVREICEKLRETGYLVEYRKDTRHSHVRIEPQVQRTRNAITFIANKNSTKQKPHVQIILRCYTSPHFLTTFVVTFASLILRGSSRIRR
jgi:hypothetical protein